MRESFRVSFEEICCGSSDKWNRYYARLGERMVQRFEQVRGALGEPLTDDSHPQVRDESSGQSPAEDEFPDRQVGRSCHPHLLSPCQREHPAAHPEVTKRPASHILQSPSEASPHSFLGFMATATFSVLILWLF